MVIIISVSSLGKIWIDFITLSKVTGVQPSFDLNNFIFRYFRIYKISWAHKRVDRFRVRNYISTGAQHGANHNWSQLLFPDSSSQDLIEIIIKFKFWIGFFLEFGVFCEIWNLKKKEWIEWRKF